MPARAAGSELPSACVRLTAHEPAAGGGGGREGRRAPRSSRTGACRWEGPEGLRSAQEQEPEALGPSRPDVRPLCLGLTARISTRCVCHPDLWPALVLCSRECWPPAHTDGCIPPHEPSTSAFWPQRGGGHSQSPDCGPQNEAEVNGTRGGRLPEPHAVPASSAGLARCTATTKACEGWTGPAVTICDAGVLQGPDG